jgi:Prokaryotic glutathione synthetase, ATP-grasp domain
LVEAPSGSSPTTDPHDSWKTDGAGGHPQAALTIEVILSPPSIALATSAEYPDGYGGDGLLTKALAARGAAPVWRVWNDPGVDWSAHDLVVLRSTWDYPTDLAGFRRWVRSPLVATRLVNSPPLVLGNLHKGYLADLGDLAVPTMVVPAGMTLDLGRLGWGAVVVKPAVAVGGDGAVRHATQADLDALTLTPAGAVDAVVQPYVQDVEHRGETSVVVVGGEPTHAVRKRPAAGEFRIHEHRGGTAELIDPAPEDLAVARATLATLRTLPAYARVDLLHDGGMPRVVELELVEPYLWFEMAPHAADALADELIGRVESGR